MILVELNRDEDASLIESMMASVADELFEGSPIVPLEEIPRSPDDLWMGALDREQLMGLAYVVEIPGLGTGTHNAHLVFGRELRGRAALETAREMIAMTFRRPEINDLWLAIPDTKRHVRLLASMLGFRRCGRSTWHWELNRDEWHSKQFPNS